MKPILSILIPTIVGREKEFSRLANHLLSQSDSDKVEILSFCDNKEMTIGAKRQLLLESCKTEYFVMIDDDDMTPPHYIATLLPHLTWYDCITYRESVRLNGREYTCNHALKYADWGDKQDGFDFVRTPYYKDVLKTEIALKVGFADMRYSEDHDFSRRIKPLLQTEKHLDEVMYIYNGKTLTPKEHKERYGIK